MTVAIARAPEPPERAREGGGTAFQHSLKCSAMRRAPSRGRLRLPEAEQALSHHEEIRQRGGHHEPMPVLGQAAVARLGEAEDAFDHPDRVLDPRAYPGLPSIRRPLPGRPRAAMDEVARVGRAHTEDPALSRVRRIAPHTPFLAV